MIEDEIREARIAIVDIDGEDVVTVIEVVSPTNKIVGASGRASYQQKRQEVFESDSHLVEIDLLREGEPIYAAHPLPDHEYLVHVSRRGARPGGMLWPIRLTQRLPIIPVPLLPDDGDAPLDLQAVFESACDRAGYDLGIDYRQRPKVTLKSPLDRWAKNRINTKGFA